MKRHFMDGAHDTFHGCFWDFVKVVNFAAPFPAPFKGLIKPFSTIVDKKSSAELLPIWKSSLSQIRKEARVYWTKGLIF